jgi:hypothetical protein
VSTAAKNETGQTRVLASDTLQNLRYAGFRIRVCWKRWSTSNIQKCCSILVCLDHVNLESHTGMMLCIDALAINTLVVCAYLCHFVTHVICNWLFKTGLEFGGIAGNCGLQMLLVLLWGFWSTRPNTDRSNVPEKVCCATSGTFELASRIILASCAKLLCHLDVRCVSFVDIAFSDLLKCCLCILKLPRYFNTEAETQSYV